MAFPLGESTVHILEFSLLRIAKKKQKQKQKDTQNNITPGYQTQNGLLLTFCYYIF